MYVRAGYHNDMIKNGGTKTVVDSGESKLAMQPSKQSSVDSELTIEEIIHILFWPPTIKLDTLTSAQKMEHWEMEYDYYVLIHEAEARRLLLNLAVKLPADSVIVDSGAHVGDTGIPLAQSLREAGRSDVYVLMVEPDASKVSWITKKISSVGNLQASAINSGLYSNTTRANILRSDAHPSGWVILPNVADGEIQLRSVADILAAERPRDVFGLWHLDVEGSELNALQGLGAHRPHFILMETKRNNKDATLAEEYLVSLGYKPMRRLGLDVLFELQG